MITIREVTENDLPDVEQLLSYTWADTYASFLSDKIIHKVTELWHNPQLLRKQIQNPHVHFLIAVNEDGTFVGLSTAVINDEKNIVLGRLYVHPQHQHRGIGTRLLKKSIDNFPEARTVHLEVEENDIKGVRFYLKHGFLEIERRQENMEGTILNVLIMEKPCA
ncbi:MAG: GNAT family N-acetyltransferase [Spirochaetae bacterium HGW-Spirochaetae-1]|jgi:ribosomal protein S18 acetylase RimI-like enzyme|nr:MAG: GNAT family N-acetyltransferase [Spirochaetae bacterium HGW-Spirochaetae-1]